MGNYYPRANLTFHTNRTISVRANGDHFAKAALPQWGTNVPRFVNGRYRGSGSSLATTLASSYLSGSGTLYFSGLTHGQLTWGTNETNAVPVVQDQPTNEPPWPLDTPPAGDVSVVYSTNLALQLLIFDGGANSATCDTLNSTACVQQTESSPETLRPRVLVTQLSLGRCVFGIVRRIRA